MKLYKGIIDAWCLRSRVASHGAKEAGQYVCIGELDGNFIRTSRIVLWTPNMIETQNSIYILAEHYEKEQDKS